MDDLVRRADALWRAVTYVCVAQLHLRANPLLTEPLMVAHVKHRPSGHWGTVPGTAFALTHIALAGADAAAEVVPILGAGHAGVTQLALAWITGELAAVRRQFSPDVAGLAALVASFPDVDGLGAEVSPHLSAGWYLGGQLGGALAFAQGAALDAAGRVVVPVLGDGECETPTTAAAWLAGQALPDPAVLPIVHVNGFRMGGRSLLGALDDDALRAYAVGLGWKPHVVHVHSASATEHREFHSALKSGIASVQDGRRTLIFLRCAKGWGGPNGSAPGAAAVHKTPLTDPHGSPEQLDVLREWLLSYRPAELLADTGAPVRALAEAVGLIGRGSRRLPAPRRTFPLPAGSTGLSPTFSSIETKTDTFADAITSVLRRHAGSDFRVFSPDELSSNRLGGLAGERWVTEVLAEEVLLGWFAGWTATGRRGLLISYEAFAPLFATGLVQLLKQRRLIPALEQLPSLNLLLTSYGWHNTYTHGDPSLTTTLLASRDPAVRVIMPADPARLALALDRALGSFGKVNIIVAGKHPLGTHPLDCAAEENARGLAIWPHASDDGQPDLVLVAAGDLPATIMCTAAPAIRRRYAVRVKVVFVQDLTVLGHPTIWPAGLNDTEIQQYFGVGIPMVIATLGHPAAAWGLIEDRLQRRVEVIGWREPTGPLPQVQMSAEAGMDVAGLCAAAARLLATDTASEPSDAEPRAHALVEQVST